MGEARYECQWKVVLIQHVAFTLTGSREALGATVHDARELHITTNNGRMKRTSIPTTASAKTLPYTGSVLNANATLIDGRHSAATHCAHVHAHLTTLIPRATIAAK